MYYAARALSQLDTDSVLVIAYLNYHVDKKKPDPYENEIWLRSFWGSYYQLFITLLRSQILFS